jgi:filamentous hemagglutinin family protein
MLLVGAAALAILCGPGALAEPQGESVVSGSATFDRSGATTTITAGNKAIINYSSFDVAANETVRFVQPSATATVLNRIQSSHPTNIDGTLQANGIVYLVNRAGVIFGPGSVVNVGGLYAAAASISNQDFLAGINRFTDAAGETTNNGTIVADAVNLIGRTVANHGSIVAAGGMVTMVAGKDVLLSEEVGGHLMVRLEGSGEQVTDRPGVENTGTIRAPGGEVLLGAGDMFSLAARQAGKIQADVVTVRVQAGTAEVTGDIDATGPAGGKVAITGEKVSIKGATIDASGLSGGGEILIGGDYQGANPDIANARLTFVNADSVLKADAVASGDGGKIIVWADQATWFYGSALARGGPGGGNGGLVEVSGLRAMDFRATCVDVTAPSGAPGRLLLDPDRIELRAAVGTATGITPPAADLVEDFTDDLGLTVVVDVQAGGTFNNIAQGSMIELRARDTIEVFNALVMSVATGNAALGTGLTMTAGGDVTIGAGITLNNGNVIVNANNVAGNQTGTGAVVITSPIVTGGGSLTTTGINFTNSGGGTITTAGGAVDIQNTGAVTVGATINATGGAITLMGDSMAISAAVTGNGGITVKPATGNRAIGIGAAPGGMDLSATELANLNTTGTLTIGAVGGSGAVTIDVASMSGENWAGLTINGGTVTFTGLLTLPDDATATFNTAGITESVAGSALTIGGTGTAIFNTSGGVTMDVAITRLGASTVGGTLSLTNDTSLTVTGAVSTAAANGPITLSAGAGTLTVSNTVNSGSGAIILIGDDMAIGAGVTTTTTLDVRPSTLTTTIGLEDATQALNLGQAELDNLSAATLTIGVAGGTGSIISGDDAAVTLAHNTVLYGGSFTTQTNATTAGANSLAVNVNAIDLQENLTADGGITIAPQTAATTIGISSGSGALNLTAAEVGKIISSGTVTIGSAAAGAVTVADSAAVSPAWNGVIIGASYTQATNTASFGAKSLTITADAIALGTDLTANAGLTIQPLTGATAIGIGAAPGGLDLSTTELGHMISTGAVTIGSATGSGAVNVGGGGAVDLSLRTWTGLTIRGGAVTFNNNLTLPDNTTATITAASVGGAASPGLTIAGGTGTLVLTTAAGATLNTAIDRLGASTVGGTLSLTNDTSLTVTGAVSTAAANGPITLSAGAGTLTVSNTVNSGSGAIILIGDDMAIGAGVTTTTTLDVRPSTLTTTIGLEDATQALNLGQAELDNLSAATLTIGVAGGTGSIISGDDAAVTLAHNTVLYGGSFTTQTNATTAGANSLAVNVNAIDLQENLTADGGITIAPQTAATTIGISSGSGALNLTAAEVGKIISSGTVTIGSAAAGAVTVADSAAVSPAWNGVIIGASYTQATNTASFGAKSLTITADAIALGTDLTANAGLTIQPLTGATAIGIGAAPGGLDLSTTELGHMISTGAVVIGSATGTGAVNVGGGGAVDLSLRTWTGLTIRGGAVTFNNVLTLPDNTVATFVTGQITDSVVGAALVIGGATGTALFTASGTVAIDTSITQIGASTVTGASLTVANTTALVVTGNLTASGVSLTAGTGGTGDLTFSGAFAVSANTISLRAGDGEGGTATAAVDAVTGAPTFQNTAGNAGPTTFTIRQDAAIVDATLPAGARFTQGLPTTYNLRSDDGAAVTINTSSKITGSAVVITGSSAGDAVTINGAAATQTGSITVNGGAGDDTFTINLAGGLFLPSGGVTLNGEGQTLSDSIILTGGSPTTVTHTFASSSSGSIDIDTSTITYTGLEPVTDNLSAVNRVFTFGNADDVITLGDEGTPTNGVSQINSTASSETVTFANPTTSLTINTGNGTNSVTVNGLDAAAGPTPYAGTITVNGGTGTDTVIAANVANTWTITGSDAGNVTGTVPFSFTAMEALVGNAAVDAFTFSAGAFAGTVNGAGGNDTFTLSGGTVVGVVTGGAGTDTLTGGNVANTWVLTGADSGTLTGTGGFTGMEALVGNAAVDAFTFSAGAFAGTVDGAGGNDTFTLNGGTVVGVVAGGAGTDTLTGGNVANTWVLTGADSGTLTGTGGFTGMEVLVGNAAVDAFTFSAGAFAGTVDGAGGNDTFTLNGGTVVGVITGGAGTDTLTGDNVVNAWGLTGAGLGTLTGTGGFTGVEVLTGGTNTDTLTIDLGTGAAVLAGMTFNGGGGSNSIVVNPGAGGPFTTVTHTFTNATDGSINVDGSVMQYTQLSLIADNLIPANRVFAFTNAADVIAVANAGAANDNISQIASSTGATVAFINPATSLTINTGAGSDLLAFAPDTAGGLPYAGAATVNATGFLTVAGVATGGDFTASAGGNLFTTGPIFTGGGDIALSSTAGSIRVGADLDSRDPAAGNAGDIRIQTDRTAMTNLGIPPADDWRPDRLVVFGTGAGSINILADSGAVYGDITINTNGVRPQVPSVATIVGDVGGGSLVFAGENFTMGSLEKMTSTGSVYITRVPASPVFMTLARLSDITAVGFMGIRANTIDFLVRAPAIVVATDGTLVGDTGMNLVANVLNVMAGPGGVTYNGAAAPAPFPAASGGSPFGTGIFPGNIVAVGPFSSVVLDDTTAPPISLSGGVNRWGLDAVGEIGFIPSNLASALASALPGQQAEVSPEHTVDASVQEELVQHLGIYTRRPTVEELLDCLYGRKFLNDAPKSEYPLSYGDFFGRALLREDNKVSVDRLPGGQAVEALAKYREVLWRQIVDPKTGKKIWRPVTGDLRKTIDKSVEDFKAKNSGKFDPVAYRKWAASSADQKEANELMAQIESLFHTIERLGLGPVELRNSFEYLANLVRPRGLSLQEMMSVILNVPAGPAGSAGEQTVTAAK